jgi:hypothetical protein
LLTKESKKSWSLGIRKIRNCNSRPLNSLRGCNLSSREFPKSSNNLMIKGSRRIGSKTILDNSRRRIQLISLKKKLIRDIRKCKIKP